MSDETFAPSSGFWRKLALWWKLREFARRDAELTLDAAVPEPPACGCCGRPSNPERTSMPRCDWCMTRCPIRTGDHTPEHEGSCIDPPTKETREQ